MKLADRLATIKPFRVMEIMERAAQLEASGRSVIHMEVGEPDFAVCKEISAAGAEAIARGDTKYTSATGLPELRRTISSYYGGLGVEVDPERIVVTSGGSGGLLLLAAALLNPSDRVLVTDPGYPCNEVFAETVGAHVSRVPVFAEKHFQPSWSDLQAHWGESVRGALLASPSNPTGTMIRRLEMQSIIDQGCDRGFLIIDEIYQGLVGDDPEYRTVLSLSSQPIVLQSFSKYFGMTGWRLGWIVIPEELIDGVRKLAQNLFISPSTIAQRAAMAAFSVEAIAEHERRRKIFRERARHLQSGLERLGLAVPATPDGAFYLYVDVSATGMSASEVSRLLLDEHLVATTPGLDFGAVNAERYLRVACTVDVDVMDEVLARIALALARG